jgi:uncharacterized protein YcaQ
MPKSTLPPSLTVSKAQARRYMVDYLGLSTPRKLAGKQAVLDFVRKVNCIQYDPINVVGQNPHLVLQARVRNYKPALLNELLYQQRSLVDGFDKVMSIYPTEDWPFFSEYRRLTGKEYSQSSFTKKAAPLMGWVLEEIKARGPLSSLELEDETRMDWWLSNTARAVRIALDILFLSGDVVVHHRAGTRRYFDLTHRVLGKRMAGKTTPHADLEAYKLWHVLRRIHSVGLARPSGTHWIGIRRSGSFAPTLARLVGRDEIVRVGVHDLPGQDFYIPRGQLEALQKTPGKARRKPGAAFIAPLDNLVWDRDLLEQLFDFYYRWEVYVPEAKREYGYYVLPVLYDDRFVARLDPGFERESKTFVLKNWWWEAGVDRKDEAMLTALQDCCTAFAKYLGAEQIILAAKPRRDTALRAMVKAAQAAL